MKKILIIGVSGLTGYRLANLLAKDFKVFGTYNKRPLIIKNCKIVQLDKTDKERTNSLIRNYNPNVIIDCSALHNVDYCETHQQETWEVNVEAPKFIAQVCKEMKLRFIYISTDYVFDGKTGNYNEHSKPNPLNFYGISKLKAEEEIVNISLNYAIVRTSLVYGWGPSEAEGLESSSMKSTNFAKWTLRKLRLGESLNIVNDQFSTPTYVDHLVYSLLALAKLNRNGIFHIAGNQCTNRYEFTCKIADVFGLDRKLIIPVSSKNFNQIAERPMNCCLNSQKSQQLLGIKPHNIYKSLQIMKEREI
ncbi:MAG: dTDP-4-dehydrorhamnose reductase [Candidatus Thorarchaeota archaeon]